MAISIGDTIDIYWANTGRHGLGTVEKVLVAMVTLRITRPSAHTISVMADRLRETAESHHWKLDL